MFEIELKERSLISLIWEISYHMRTDLEIIINKNKMISRFSSKKYNCIIELAIEKKLFSKYNVTESTTIYFKKGEKFTDMFRYSEGFLTIKGNAENLTFIEKYDGIEEITMKNTDELKESIKFPECYMEVNAVLPYKTFRKLSSYCIGEVHLISGSGKLITKTTYHEAIERRYFDPTIIKIAESVYSSNALHDLRMISSGTGCAEELLGNGNVYVCFDNGSPLNLVFNNADGVVLKYYLAPSDSEED